MASVNVGNHQPRFQGINVTPRQLEKVVLNLGADFVRQNGTSHQRFVTSAGVPFGIPAGRSVSPGIFGEVASVLGVRKADLLTWCRDPKAFKRAKKSGLEILA